MNLIERFRYIMKLNNLTASAFADQINVQRSSVSHILSGRNKPSLEFIQKVITKYPKIDAAWLINGTTTPPKTILEESVIDAPIKKEDKRQKKDEILTKQAVLSSNQDKSGKTVDRIVLFYSDSTFQEFKP